MPCSCGSLSLCYTSTDLRHVQNSVVASTVGGQAVPGKYILGQLVGWICVPGSAAGSDRDRATYREHRCPRCSSAVVAEAVSSGQAGWMRWNPWTVALTRQDAAEPMGVDWAGQGCPRQHRATGAAFRIGLNMIIVSKPSAKATKPGRTSRYKPARRRSSAARNDTRRQVDARPISVHTKCSQGSSSSRQSFGRPAPSPGRARSVSDRAAPKKYSGEPRRHRSSPRQRPRAGQ
jgi:hypothetical protein